MFLFMERFFIIVGVSLMSFCVSDCFFLFLMILIILFKGWNLFFLVIVFLFCVVFLNKKWVVFFLFCFVRGEDKYIVLDNVNLGVKGDFVCLCFILFLYVCGD